MPIRDVRLGRDVKIPYPDLVNLYECEIGDECFIGPFVEIQKGAKMGSGCRVQSHSFICTKVGIGNGVFIGHGVVFINDRHPPRFEEKYWEETVVGDNVVIGGVSECGDVGGGFDLYAELVRGRRFGEPCNVSRLAVLFEEADEAFGGDFGVGCYEHSAGLLDFCSLS